MVLKIFEVSPTTNVSNSAQLFRTPSYLGPELKVRGQINGDEDLKIDGKIEGPISHRQSAA